MRNGLCVLALLDVLMTLTLTGASNPLETNVDPDSAFDFLPTDLTIFDPHEKQIIGHGRYSVTQTNGTEVVQGENEYLDGRHDQELERLRLGTPGETPILLSASTRSSTRMDRCDWWIVWTRARVQLRAQSM